MPLNTIRQTSNCLTHQRQPSWLSMKFHEVKLLNWQHFGKQYSEVHTQCPVLYSTLACRLPKLFLLNPLFTVTLVLLIQIVFNRACSALVYMPRALKAACSIIAQISQISRMEASAFFVSLLISHRLHNVSSFELNAQKLQRQQTTSSFRQSQWVRVNLTSYASVNYARSKHPYFVNIATKFIVFQNRISILIMAMIRGNNVVIKGTI